MPSCIGRDEVRADVDGVLVTRSDGRLLGMLERYVARRALKENDDADR